MPGYVHYCLNIKGEKGIHKCRFENGAVSGTGFIAASFSTDNEKLQKLIESDAKYKAGQIKIAEVYGVPEENENPKMSKEDKVTNIQEARAFLLEMGVPFEELQTKTKVLNAAKEKNISFPNWR